MHIEEQQQQPLWEVHPAPAERVISAAALAAGGPGSGGPVPSLGHPRGQKPAAPGTFVCGMSEPAHTL